MVPTFLVGIAGVAGAVSYTHLDVYKRQVENGRPTPAAPERQQAAIGRHDGRGEADGRVHDERFVRPGQWLRRQAPALAAAEGYSIEIEVAVGVVEE